VKVKGTSEDNGFYVVLVEKDLANKDNLAKQNWNGCIKYVFYDSEESIPHLFISCLFAHLVWRIVEFTFNLPVYHHQLILQICLVIG
jgi:hypothetical protein